GGLATIEEPESFLPVESESELRPRAKIFIALAGPAAGFLLAGGLIGALYACRFGFEIQWGRPIGIIPVLGSLWDKNAALAYLVFDLLFINIFWGAMNLLPVYPLDGGQVARELFSLGNPRAGLEKSLLLSTVTGAVVAVLVLTQLGFPEGILPALMFGLLAIASYRALTQVRAMGAGGAGYYGPEADDDDWWKK
ncbi:MAG: M50 family metallopeptidase, partial [Planctomycetia bacterium]|nr:M50 family metallopeptidase [Planctomycetia bacterium]